ncbi:MAG: 16S rRNA (cytosine(1402)-N(4))-methyltransferase [Candidatus Melainabacteria bacterium GWF2_37_15]|nr:MAG: 16S rRNA (cytosine(1402)-N(4))-methyltransferase [Candidatus Melainabacteria bacterium GWF2_37_15]
MSDFIHKTVLLNEAVDLLNCQKGKTYIDATAGGGGHSFEIARRIYPEGRLIMFDTDPDAIKAASAKLEPYKEITTIIKANYSEIPEYVDKIDGGILFDLGVSSHQLTSGERGFSFVKESPLDMRMDPENPINAYDIVNTESQDELYRIFKELGEERFSGRIARRIVEARKIKKITTTVELADIVKKSVPFQKNRRIHPATRVFQALRIAVNNELDILEKTLNEVVQLLDKDARIVVISFHSLEDRLVKNTFKGSEKLKVLTKKPLVPTYEETRSNPSARSAKMRAAEAVE